MGRKKIWIMNLCVLFYILCLNKVINHQILQILVLENFAVRIQSLYFFLTYVDIISQTYESDFYGPSHKRQQFPIKIAWEITVHKSERLPLFKKLVDIGKNEQFTGWTYVELSRVRKQEHLITDSRKASKYKIKKRINTF